MTDTSLAARCAEAMYARDRASQGLGIEVVRVDAGEAVLTMRVRDDMIQGHGSCHGGFIFALADSAFAFACNTYDKATVAQGCSIEFVAPGRVGDLLTATCVEQSRSNRTGTYDTRIENQDGYLVALFRGKSYQLRGSVIAQESGRE